MLGNLEEDFAKKDVHWHRLTDYQPDNRSQCLPVILKSTRPTGELLFKHEFIVTKLELAFGSDVLELYHQRGSHGRSD